MHMVWRKALRSERHHFFRWGPETTVIIPIRPSLVRWHGLRLRRHEVGQIDERARREVLVIFRPEWLILQISIRTMNTFLAAGTNMKTRTHC